MPEGDAVYRTARRLHRALSGKVLTRSDVRVPRFATVDLRGATVVETVARGKHLLTRITGSDTRGGSDLTLHTHLRMEGTWQVLTAPGARWRRPAHTARIILGAEGVQAVGFSLGVLEFLPTPEEHTVVGHLGPDLLGPDWDADRAVALLRAQPDRRLGEALLDQRNLAGLGTMWMAETCFLAGEDPSTPVAAVRDLPRLVARSQALLRHHRDGRTREPLWVFEREDRDCRRCGTRIRLTQQGEAGRERRWFWCPGCQPLRPS